MWLGGLPKLGAEDALGAGGVRWAAGSVGAGSVAAGCSVVRAACSVALAGVVSTCASMGATVGETGPSSRITRRLEGGESWVPSSPERSTAASPVSVMYSAIQGISCRSFRTSWSFACVDGAEGPEADSLESGANGSELATSISLGAALRRVEGPGDPGSSSYVVN